MYSLDRLLLSMCVLRSVALIWSLPGPNMYSCVSLNGSDVD